MKSEAPGMRILIPLLMLSLLAFGCSPSATPAASPSAQASHDHDGHDHGDHAHPDATGTPGAQPTLAPIADPPEGAKVMFASPADGDTVKSPVKVVMAVEGMEVRPAGTMEENTGHHHLLIDREGVPKGEVVPTAKNAIHFGKGQTETELELEPGKHTIRMQFADYAHRSYGPALSTQITVTVE